MSDNDMKLAAASSTSPDRRASRPQTLTRGLSVRHRQSIQQSIRTSIRSSQSSSGSFKVSDDEMDGNAKQRPSERNLVRQQSWYKDLLEQGMSEADIAALLGEEGLDNEGSGTVGGSSDEALLEQHSIMAHSEARRRLIERLGYDPWEQQASQKKPPPTVEDEDLHILYPAVDTTSSAATSTDSKSTVSTPQDLFAWNPNHYIHPKVTRTPPDLVEGEKAEHRKATHSGEIIVKCLGCRQAQAVSALATLVRCPTCRTVSPASSTRK